MQTNGDPYTTDTATDTRRVRYLNRFTVAQAAERLGITQDAVRQRIRRDTIRHEKDEDGRVYVYLDSTHTDHDSVRDTVQDGVHDDLVEELRDRVRALEEANRENRRIIAALTSRIPQLEAPRDEPEPPVTASEPTTDTNTPPPEKEPKQRSWWQRFFR